VHLWSPTFIKEEWKRVVREMDGKISEEISRRSRRKSTA
jgi:hypothetical protein